MKMQLTMPQEVEVFYVIPAIRRELAITMKAAGKKQKEIAKLLCVEESTISQYLNDKRAVDIKFNDEIKQQVADSASNIHDRISFIGESQKLLKLIKEDRTLCQVHRAVAGLPKSCDVCFK